MEFQQFSDIWKFLQSYRQYIQDGPLFILMDHSLCRNNIVFLSLKIDFVLANGADPAEMPHYATFHLGLRCLPKYSFRGYLQSTKVLVDNLS